VYEQFFLPRFKGLIYQAHIAVQYTVCRLVSVRYIVICNTVRLIVGKVTLRNVVSTALCGF